MGEYAECKGCHRYGFTEIHHIVEKSHAPYMRNVKLNFLNLCSQCHRLGKHAVHNDRKVDLQYKQELQLKFQQLFNKEYYNIHQIKCMLGISKSETENLCRHLKIYKEGYKNEDLIFHMMGDKNYLEWEIAK